MVAGWGREKGGGVRGRGIAITGYVQGARKHAAQGMTHGLAAPESPLTSETRFREVMMFGLVAAWTDMEGAHASASACVLPQPQAAIKSHMKCRKFGPRSRTGCQ